MRVGVCEGGCVCVCVCEGVCVCVGVGVGWGDEGKVCSEVWFVQTLSF